MEKEPDTPTTEGLNSQECWGLLRQVSVGRLAVWLEDGPTIFPVNYTTDHGTVVFRTGTGAELAAAFGYRPVAMEVDGVNPETGIAWSILIRGTAELLTRTDDALTTFSLPLFPWESGKKDHFVRVVPGAISGRRFTVASPNIWWSPAQWAMRSAEE